MKENIVRLYGWVTEMPLITQNMSTGELSARMIVQTLKRNYVGEKMLDRLFYDDLIIMTQNKRTIDYIAENVRPGDMVDIKGVLCSMDLPKEAVCPECRHKNIINEMGVLTYINPFLSIRVHEKGLDKADARQRLKEEGEISNEIRLFGKIVKEPSTYEDAIGNKYSAYEVYMKRRVRIPEDPVEKRGDYVWIRTYGNQAEEARQLKQGWGIYVSGAVQARTVKRVYKCEKCGMEHEYYETPMEVVPYTVEHIPPMIFDEDEQILVPAGPWNAGMREDD